MFDSIWGDVKNTFEKQKNLVPKLIVANIIAFLLLNGGPFNFTFLFSKLFRFDFNVVYRFFALPIHIEELVWRPWTLLTYGFLHNDFWHIIYNMLFLYYFGNILQEYLGNKKLLTVFFAGIVISGIAEIAAYQILRFAVNEYPIGYTVGASGAVMAVLAAAATLLPDYSLMLFVFNIRLKYIFIFYFLIDLLSLANGDNWGGHVTHLAGAIFGYFYIKDIYKHAYIDNFIDLISTIFKPKTKLKVVHRRSNFTPRNEAPYHRKGVKPNQQEIDEILDKISKSGYDSLNKAEKEILFAASDQN